MKPTKPITTPSLCWEPEIAGAVAERANRQPLPLLKTESKKAVLLTN